MKVQGNVKDHNGCVKTPMYKFGRWGKSLLGGHVMVTRVDRNGEALDYKERIQETVA